jgi:hypothetical protein
MHVRSCVWICNTPHNIFKWQYSRIEICAAMLRTSRNMQFVMQITACRLHTIFNTNTCCTIEPQDRFSSHNVLSQNYIKNDTNSGRKLNIQYLTNHNLSSTVFHVTHLNSSFSTISRRVPKKTLVIGA